MKRILSLSILALSMTCVAQVPADFNVAPPKYTKMVRCNADDGVNVRKFPSATAPRALYDENKIEYFDFPVAVYSFWSTGKTGGSIHAAKFTGVKPMISESNGWYEVPEVGPVGKDGMITSGWVSGQYCTAFDIIPITPSLISAKNLSLQSADDGKLMVYYSSDDMNSEYSFYVGKLVNGQLVCPYMWQCGSIEETTGPSCVRKNEYGSFSIYCNANEKDEWGNLDLRKIKGTLIKDVLAKAEKLENPVTVYYNGEWLDIY